MTSSYRPDTDYAKGLAIAMIESICILLIFLMFFPKVRDMISKELVIPEEKPATLTIDPSRTLPDTPPPADARQQQPQFMQTTAAQESPDTPKDPKFFSALNTVAASSSPGAKPTNAPNQAGEKTPALGFANSPQSAASDGSNNPQRQTQQQQQQSSRQQQAQPAQNPQQQQRQNQQQQPKPQEATRTPDKAQNQPTASPNQIKPLEKAPENPPPDIKQAERTAMPKPSTPALMTSDSQMAESVKFNNQPKLRTDNVADTPTVAAPDATEKAQAPRVMNLEDVTLAQLAAMNPRSDPPPSPMANPNSPSAPASAPSTFEQRTAIEGGQTAVIRSMTSFDSQATPMGRYVQYVLNKIKFRWLNLVSDPGKIGLLKVGTVRAKFDLMADGTVQNLQVVSDSGDVIFSGLCRDAIWYPGAQYNPFPPGVAAALGEKKEFEISFALY